MTAAPFVLEPSPIHVSDELLADLQNRLQATRWPLDAGNDDWFYGISRNYLEKLVDYWINEFDWRKSEKAINAYKHYKVNVDGVPVQFMRKPGVGPNPVRPKIVYRIFSKATGLLGINRSTSQPTNTVDTSSPGKLRTSGLTICAAPSEDVDNGFNRIQLSLKDCGSLVVFDNKTGVRRK